MMVWALLLVCVAAAAAKQEFSNQWVAEIHGGEEVARRVAREQGFNFEKPAIFDNHYILTRPDHPQVSARDSIHLTNKLTDLDEVKWAEQQPMLDVEVQAVIPEHNVPKAMDFNEFLASLQKEGISYSYSSGDEDDKPADDSSPADDYSSSSDDDSSSSSGALFDFASIFVGPDEGKKQGDLSKLGTFSHKPAPKSSLSSYSGVTENIGLVSTKKSAYADMFNDPLWSKQWAYQDYRTEDGPVLDHNIVPVWKSGITGKGVTVVVVDQGVEHGHPDLGGNFKQEWSYDAVTDTVGTCQPDPPSAEGVPNAHGTSCAGQIAMVANNGKCGVGIAYDSNIAGVKLIAKGATAYSEVTALNHLLDKADIYSNSWGSPSNGKTLARRQYMTEEALRKGVTEGRNGKGALYVFSAGNGRNEKDNCAADPQMNSLYTIGIASSSQHGKTTWYSERCPAVMATCYSGGGQYDEYVSTLSTDGECMSAFSGTSAAAPVASGIIALALQANPDLTYRDVQHLIAATSEVAPLADNEGSWYKNGAGFWVSNDFGFGLLNALNMVEASKNWQTVPAQKYCTVTIPLGSNKEFSVGKPAKFSVKTNACKFSQRRIDFLETIELASSISYPYRGAISINIVSPMGTKTTLMEPRDYDDHVYGFDAKIKSFHNWGEDPKGTWEIEIVAKEIEDVSNGEGEVDELELTLYGTTQKPAHYAASAPFRTYSAFRLADGTTN